MNGENVIVFPGDQGYNANNPKAIVDYWGEPIHYYRKNYPEGALGLEIMYMDRYGGPELDPAPTLSDVFALRPFNVDTGADRNTRFEDNSPLTDTTTTFALDGGDFALLSKGPDQAWDPDARVDVDRFNQDNIVEVGP